MANTSIKEPKAGTVPAVLLAAIRAAGRSGLSLDQICTLGLPQDRQQLNTRANRLVHSGFVFKAGKGKVATGRMRFFELEDAAEAWENSRAVNPVVRADSRKTQAMAEIMERRSHANERQAKLRASNRSTGEMVITEATRRTKADTPPAHRYEVTGRVDGGLGSMGIGRYAEAASGWAAAAIGGAR